MKQNINECKYLHILRMSWDFGGRGESGGVWGRAVGEGLVGGWVWWGGVGLGSLVPTLTTTFATRREGGRVGYLVPTLFTICGTRMGERDVGP